MVTAVVTAVVTATPPASHRVRFLSCHGAQLLAFLRPGSSVFPAPSLVSFYRPLPDSLPDSPSRRSASCFRSNERQGPARRTPELPVVPPRLFLPLFFVFLAPRSPELSTPGSLTPTRSPAPPPDREQREGESVADRVGVAFSPLCTRRRKVGVFVASGPPGTVGVDFLCGWKKKFAVFFPFSHRNGKKNSINLQLALRVSRGIKVAFK